MFFLMCVGVCGVYLSDLETPEPESEKDLWKQTGLLCGDCYMWQRGEATPKAPCNPETDKYSCLQ